MTLRVFGVDQNYNSYATREDADAYHTERATPGWSAASVEAKEAALVRATDYIDINYNFGGALAPNELLQKATFILASHALADTLTGRAEMAVVESEQELAGVGKKRTVWSGRKVDPFPAVTAMLGPLTVSSTATGVSTARIIR